MYELMVIGDPKTDSERVLALVDKALKDADATSVKVDKLGRKNLMFPIAKQAEGEYMVFNFEAEADKIAVINSKLRLEQEAILRYLITKVSKAPKVSQEEAKAAIGKEDKRPVKTKKAKRAS